ncbi:MAG: hypothetical protein ACE37F_01760 [Nannocystaceae bacterium]|nr:cytochrome c [bacterium]
MSGGRFHWVLALALGGCGFDSSFAELDTDTGSTSMGDSGAPNASTSASETTADSDSNSEGGSSGGDEVDVCAQQGVPAQWTEGELISPCGRPNPLGLEDAAAYAQAGQGHALHYPVETTGILLPERPLRTLIEGNPNDPLRQLLSELLPAFTGLSSMEEIYEQLGLVRGEDGEYWGVTVMNTDRGAGLTFSCATCHSGRVFDTPTLGLFNRRSTANNMFVVYKPLFEQVGPAAFALGTGADSGETDLWAMSRDNIRYVRSVDPRALGLDTALAHTILSLGTRELDPWATRTEQSWQNPRSNELEHYPSDVKPATWWLTKYKNKYFSDGSLVSGNPVLGALLVNEFGRGSDLVALDAWIIDNWDVIEEFTTGVFATEAPSFFDHFEPEAFDLAAAKRGEALFVDNCARCHGTYQKGWSKPDADSLSVREQLETVQVVYFADTPIHDVGTDPHRRRSVEFIQDINDLALSEKYDLVLTPQDGYVPPPLEGIWARWPYFHNNSAPSLCAVLTPADQRPVVYQYGNVTNGAVDFDSGCNGYPLDAPPHFDQVFDTTVAGLSNMGHDEGILMDGAQERFSAAEKTDLIRFLQTL